MLTKQEFETKFLDLYTTRKDLNITDVCDLLGENRNRGYKLVKKLEIETHFTPRKYNIETIEKIKEEYLTGKTIKELIISYPEMEEGIINYWLRKNKITRPNGKSAKLNHNYFSNIDTELKAYFLGLIFADGSVRHNLQKGENSWSVSIGLNFEDGYILKEFLKDIESALELKCYTRKHEEKIINDKIYSYDGRKTATVVLYSKQLASDLIKLGCEPNKTYTLEKTPEIPKELIKWFILGFYDGDGIASSGKETYIGFCGTENMMLSISGMLSKELNIQLKKVYYNKSNNIYYLQYNKKEEISKIYEYFYENNNIIFMKRKKEKIKKYLNN